MVSKHRMNEPISLWKGYRLYAGDGSTVSLPPTQAIKNHFGVESITKYGIERSLSRVFMVYSVLDRFVHDAELGLMKKGEKTMLMDSLARMPLESNSILLLDRGFGNFCMLKELQNQKYGFCIRISETMSNFAKRAMKHPLDDYITQWVPSEKSKENLRKNKLDFKPIEVRVTKIRLASGETELLVSSLFDQNTVKPLELAELYHLRWGVEEGFKNLKPKMKLGYFGCGKPEGVLQEFYAHIFCMNMVALAGSVAEKIIKKKTESRRLAYTYNWKNAYRIIRERIAGLLFYTSAKAAKLLEEIYELVSASIIAIKPDRTFLRDMRECAERTKLSPINK